MKTIIKDAKTTIIEAYSELDKLFDSRLSKYKTYAGKDLVLGIKGADDKKTCHMDIQREVFVEGNYDKAKFEIHDLLKDAEKLVSKYEGMKISDGETKYIGQKPIINCDYNHIKTQFNIFILFKEIDDINEDIEDVWYNDDWTIDDEDNIDNYEENGFNNELSFKDFLNEAEIILVDNAFEFDINEWEKENQEEINEELSEDINNVKNTTTSQFIKYQLTPDKVKEIVNKIINSEFNIINYWKTNQFKKKNNLTDDDLKDILRTLTEQDYKTNSISIDNSKNEAIIFIKQINIKNLNNIKVYIKLDYDSIENSPVIVLSFHNKRQKTQLISSYKNIGSLKEEIKLKESSEKEYYYNYDVLCPIYYKGGVIHRDEEAYAKSYEDLCKQVRDDWIYDDDLEDVEKYGSIKVKVNYSDDPKFKSEDDEGDLDEGYSKDKYLEETSPYTNIKSNGIYSLNTGWVKHPVQQDIPDIDMEEFEKQFKVWEDKYFNLLDALNVDDKNKSNQINESQDEDFDFNWDDIKDYNLEFAKEIYDIIDSFIDKDNITENFKNKSSLKYHFNKHCVGDKIKKSTKTNVLYDFTNIDDYKEYEKNYLNNKNNSDILILTSLGSPEHVADIFRKFFEGNKYLILDTLCGFQNNNKSVSIILHSFANKATTNYNQNTIDFNVTADDITKTLYPVDSYYLETKLNNVIQKYNINKLSIKINNGKEIKTESHESEYVPKSYSNPKIEQIDNLIEDIYKLRQEGMKEEGEYSIKNLIFKEFRNLGYLDNLKELKRKEVSKELSLEGLDKK